MKKIAKASLIVLSSFILFGCSNSNKETKDSSTINSTKKVNKKKTKDTSESSSQKKVKTTPSEKSVKAQVSETSQEQKQEISQEKSLHGQLEQEAQDKFWEAKSWGWSDQKASAYADGGEYVEEQKNNINSDADAVNLAITTYGDNDGDWVWGSMGEVDGGYFIKAISKKSQETTMTGTAKSLVVHYDGSITEN